MSIKYDATGFYNLREAGGMPATGGRVKTERILRSDFPDSLDGEDVEFFQEMPLTAVIDLRDAEEVQMSPRLFKDAGFNVVEMPVFAGSAMSMAKDVPSVEELYLYMVQSSPSVLTEAVVQIADATGKGAALVHCTAGKDRTGVVCALTQAVLGVSDADIVKNYTQSQKNLSGAWLTQKEAQLKALLASTPQAAGINVDEFLPLLTGSPASAIEGALAAVRKEHGTVEGFLLANGATRIDLTTLRGNLIE